MEVEYMKFNKEKILFFLLFLIPSIRLVDFTTDLIYPLVMNSKIIFKIVSFLLWIIFTYVLVILFSFVESKLPKKLHKKIFNIIVILVSIFFILSTLLYILLNNGIFIFGSCGKEFNELYIESAKSNDPSFCLNPDIEVNGIQGVKGGSFCKTPNKDAIQLFADSKPYASSCLTSFAIYTDDISHCDIIETNNLKIGYSLSSSGFTGNKYHCIMEYAIYKLDAEYCDLLPKGGEFSDRNQCLKILGWKTGDESLCEKISSNSSLKNACLANLGDY